MDYLYIDSSSLLLEGRKVSAVHNGHAVDVWQATEQNILDTNYYINFGQILNVLELCTTTEQINLYGAVPFSSDCIWSIAKTHDITVNVFKENGGKRIVRASLDMMEDSFLYMNMLDRIILIANDDSYIPCIEKIIENDMKVIVAFWSNVSGELKRTCSEFIDLDNYCDKLSQGFKIK